MKSFTNPKCLSCLTHFLNSQIALYVKSQSILWNPSPQTLHPSQEDMARTSEISNLLSHPLQLKSLHPGPWEKDRLKFLSNHSEMENFLNNRMLHGVQLKIGINHKSTSSSIHIHTFFVNSSVVATFNWTASCHIFFGRQGTPLAALPPEWSEAMAETQVGSPTGHMYVYLLGGFKFQPSFSKYQTVISQLLVGMKIIFS